MFPHYIPQNLLFAELLHKMVYVEDAPYLLFPIFNPILIWLISKKIFKGFLALVPPLIFLISPWGWYLAIAHSFYIFMFFLTLIIVYTVILIRSGSTIPGNILLFLASLIAIYCSSFFLVFIPLALIILLNTKIISIKNIKTAVVLLVIFTLPLLFIINKEKANFKNEFSNEVKIFSDPSLLNSINRYQGAAAQIGLRNLSRISENKYLFFTEYSLLKYASQLAPETFFTPQYKLLGFSFSPPIFMGFAIPFIYGLYLALKKPDLRKLLFVSSILTVPSILANETVALNRLILFSPVIFILISYGLIILYKKRKNVLSRSFLILTLFLVMFQLIVTVSDIRTREGQRFAQYFGNKYEINEP